MRRDFESAVIGLLVRDLADRRLLSDFLDQTGFSVRIPAESETTLEKALEEMNASLIIADAHFASRHGESLFKLKQRLHPLYLPLLVTLPAKVNGTPWLRAGFDDLLRLPLIKDELLARLEVFLRSRRHSEKALQESSERFRATFDKAPVGIAHTSLNGQFIMVNPRLCEILGYGERELLSLSLQDVAPPEEGSWRGSETFITGKAYTFERRHIRRDETAIWLSVTSSLVDHANGATQYLIVVVEDITVRKSAEEAQARMNEILEKRVAERTAQLEASNKELEAFSYSVSHDLRAPLRAMNGFCKMLSLDYSSVLDKAGNEYINRIQGAGERMALLVEGLLNLSRVTRAELQHVNVDLTQLARQIADQLSRDEPGRMVNFVIESDVVVKGDPTLLRAALENLLGNAWKYTAKHATARIEFGVRPGEDGHLVYFVRDDGAGFDMRQAGQLFEPFHRLHKSSEFPGTGVGLTTVQRIVQRHGGCIWAEGAVGQGAVFSFTLPGREFQLTN